MIENLAGYGSRCNLFVSGLVQLMRRCRKHLLLHLIPSPSGFFVAGLEGGGPRDEKSQRRRCMSVRFLSLRGIQSGGYTSSTICAFAEYNILEFAFGPGHYRHRRLRMKARSRTVSHARW